MLTVTFYGNAAFSIASPTTTVLVDPYLTANPECPWDAAEVYDREKPTAVCVTHASFDHVGEAAELAITYDLPVLTEPATVAYLESLDVPDRLLTSAIWGMAATIGDLSIRVLETRHASIRTVDDRSISGVPVSFLVSHEGSTVYHMGDTAIFRDLKTYGELFDIDVMLVGVGQAFDGTADSDGTIVRLVHELTIDEAVLTTRWLAADRAVPMHFIEDECDRFLAAMAESDTPADAVPLEPGEHVRC